MNTRFDQVMESSRENETMAETTQKTSDSSDWENMLISDFDFHSDLNFKNDQDSRIDVLDEDWLDSLQSALLNDDLSVFFSDIPLTSNHTTSETALMNQTVTIEQPEDDGTNKPEKKRKTRDSNQNAIDGIAKQLNFSANVARMAKQYLDFVCASSTDKQRKGMSLELIAVVCFYIACNEKDGNDPRSIDQIRVVWKSNLLHSRQKVIYNNCYDLVCQLLGKSVDVLESTIKRFARKIGLSDAKCESALLLCSRAFKAFPAEMKVKEHKTVAAAALFEVAHICNLSEYSRRLGMSTWTIKQLTKLWSTKSGEILLDPLTDVSPAPTQLNVGIKRTIKMNLNDADRDTDRLLPSSANKKRKINSSNFEYSVASTSAALSIYS